MTEAEETDLCDKTATEASNLIVDRLAKAEASGMSVVLTAEMVAVAMLVKAGNDPGIIELFLKRIKERTDEYRRKKAN